MILQSKRIVLHEFREIDAMALYKYRSKKEVERYQSFKNFSLEEAKQTTKLTGPKKLPGNYQWGIYIEEKLIGDLHFHITKELYCFIGYTIDSIYWHKGYGYEACLMSLSYLSRYLDIHHFYVYIEDLNKASISLASKLGFKKINHQLYYLYV